MLELPNTSLDELLRAIECNDRDLILRVLPRIENLNQENLDGDTPLETAARVGNPEVVRLLIRSGAEVNYSTDAYFFTALMSAAGQGHTATVQFLLDAGAKVDAKDDWGYTSLMRAAERGHLEVVSVLLKHGADPNLIDDRGKTAADLAEEAGYMDIAVSEKALTPLQKLGWLRRFF